MVNDLQDQRVGWRPSTHDVAFYLICFAFLYLHLFTFPAYPIYYEADHIAALNDAKRLVDGEFIYRDFFEFSFPGTAALYALLISIFGSKLWILNAAIILHGMAAAFLGVVMSRLVGLQSSACYLASSLFLFFGFRWFGIDGEHRMFSPIFVYLALVVTLKSRSNLSLAVAGALCAAASFFSQQRGFLAVISIILFVIAETGVIGRNWKLAVRSGVVVGASASICLAVLLAPFIFFAGPEVFFQDTIAFLRTYAQDAEFNSVQTYITTFTKIQSTGITITLATLFYSILIPLIYLIALGFVIVKSGRRKFNETAAILCVCLIGLLQAIATSGPNIYRLYQVSIPALVVFVWLLYRSSVLKPIAAKIAVAGLAIFGLALGIRLQTEWNLQPLDTVSGRLVFPSPVTSERYLWLQQNTNAGDAVYEAYNSHVNFPLGLKNPCRISVLLNSAYSPKEHVQWVIDDLKRARPRYIIWDGTWTSELNSDAGQKTVGPVYDFMKENYEFVRSFTPYENRLREVWELKTQP